MGDNEKYVPKVWVTNSDYLKSDDFKFALAGGVKSGQLAVDQKYLGGMVVSDESMTRNMSFEEKQAWKKQQQYLAGAYERKLIRDKEKASENAKNQNNTSNSTQEDEKNKKLLWIGGGIFLLVIIGLLAYYFID